MLLNKRVAFLHDIELVNSLCKFLYSLIWERPGKSYFQYGIIGTHFLHIMIRNTIGDDTTLLIAPLDSIQFRFVG